MTHHSPSRHYVLRAEAAEAALAEMTADRDRLREAQVTTEMVSDVMALEAALAEEKEISHGLYLTVVEQSRALATTRQALAEIAALYVERGPGAQMQAIARRALAAGDNTTEPARHR